MEDLVAVRLTLASGTSRYVITWGRIQATVDPQPLEQLVLANSSEFSLGEAAVSAAVCTTLQEASREPYFFEALFSFAQQRLPFGDGYEAWRAKTDHEMRRGKHIYFLGTP